MNTSQSSFSFALRTAIFALVCTMWSINAEAVEPVGKVQFVLGDVTAVNGGESRQLKKMDPIYESDTIKTGPKGSAQLMMMDSARIAVRPNSAFIIAEYRLDGDNSASVLSILKGGFRTLSGKIGEQAKENYRVETPTGTIGLRGTDHAVFHIPKGQEKSYGDGLAGTYSKVYEGSTILQNEDKILVITPATDAGYVAKDAAPKYVKAIPETAEGPVVVAPADETESDEEAADESEVAAAPDEESDDGETESEAKAEIVVPNDESGNEPEPREIAPAPVVPKAAETPVADITGETIADAIQRETQETIMEESRNAALAQFELTHFNGALSEGGFLQNNPQNNPYFRIERTTGIDTFQPVRFRITGADADEFTLETISGSPNHFGEAVGCDGTSCAVLFLPGDAFHEFRIHPTVDGIAEGSEQWGIEVVNVEDVAVIRDFRVAGVPIDRNIIPFDVADGEVEVSTFSVDDTGREEESFQIRVETARSVRSEGQIRFRIIGANPNEFTLSPGVACDSGGLCTATLPVGEREFAFTLTPLYDEQSDAENWEIVLVDDNPRIFVEDSVQLEWNIAIADVVAEVQIANANAVARTTFDEGESVQLRISSSQTSPAGGGGLEVQFRINGADRNEIGVLPTGVSYSTEDGVYSATIPAGQREFTFNLITLTDSTDETSGEEWTVTLISDPGLYTGDSQVAFTVIDPQVAVIEPPVDPPVDPPVTPNVPANFFGGGFETLTNPDASLNLALPTDWIIGTGGILAIQDPSRIRSSTTAPMTGIDIFPRDTVYNAIAAGDKSHAQFGSGRNVFYRTDSDGRFVNNSEGNAGRLSRQGEGGADYFTFSYALETGERTFLTNYQVETRFFLNARENTDGIPNNEGREFGHEETWQFGTTTRTELNQRETFFPVTGTVENLQANIVYGRMPGLVNEGTEQEDFAPGTFDYDISGQASFGTDNSKIFSRFDVQVTDAERCRGADTGCYDDRLVGKFEADANP